MDPAHPKYEGNRRLYSIAGLVRYFGKVETRVRISLEAPIKRLQDLWRFFRKEAPPEPVLEPKAAITYYKYKSIWDALYGVQEGKCFHCDQSMKTYTEALKIPRKKRGGIHRATTRATRDHIVTCNEQRRKGWHIPIQENAILSCGTCNNRRGNDPLSPEKFARAMEINRQALLAYATERVATKAEVRRKVVGESQQNQHDREMRAFKEFPTSQWSYLFHDACRLMRRNEIVPKYFRGDLGGATAD